MKEHYEYSEFGIDIADVGVTILGSGDGGPGDSRYFVDFSWDSFFVLVDRLNLIATDRKSQERLGSQEQDQVIPE